MNSIDHIEHRTIGSDPDSPLSLEIVAERLRTQDNRITAHPMFCVQVKKRDIGYHRDYADGETVWLLDGGEVPPNTPHAEEFGYKDRWETVMVAFTEAGCEEYLQLNGHNYRGEKRIYAASFYRCPEMLAIRQALLDRRIGGLPA